MTGTVYFSHGRDSGPGARKIRALAPLARERGFRTVIPDYTGIFDPDTRVKLLLSAWDGRRPAILVGSSMGAYVSVVASEQIRPAVLLLFAPAVGLLGVENPTPYAERVVVVHGWADEVVPVKNAVVFAEQHRAELHLLDADHSLTDQLPFLERLLADILDDLIEGGKNS